MHAAEPLPATLPEVSHAGARGTVLVVAHHFPPMGGVCAIRMGKTVKHLSRLGWRSVVLSACGASYYAREDLPLAEELPRDVRVRDLPAREAGVLLGLFRKLGFSPASLRWMERALFLPDPQAGWIPGALREGLSLARLHRPRLIYAAGAPWSCLVAGAMLSRMTGIPLVSHFADEWSRDPWYRPVSPVHRTIQRGWESWVLRRSAAVTVSSPRYPDRFREGRPWLEAGRFFVVPNSYDEEDFAGIPVRPDQGRFTLLHAGALYASTCDPRPFLRALGRFLAEEPGRAAQVRLRLMGYVEKEFEQTVHDLGLSPVTEIEGAKTHREAVRAMASSDVLLAFLSDYDGAGCILRAKCLEYLRAGRPVLAMVPPSSFTAEVLRRGGVAPIAPGDDAGALASLCGLWGRWQSGLSSGTAVPGEVLENFEHRAAARTLAGVFERVGRP